MAAGRDDGGESASFSLTPSDQTTLLGEAQYSEIFEVDKGWRGGFGEVSLLAKGTDRGNVYNSTVCSGMRFRLCLLYLDGDAELRRRADSVADRLRTLNSNLAPRVDVLQADEVALILSTKYRAEDDVTRGRTSSTLVGDLAAYYYAAQASKTTEPDPGRQNEWNSEIRKLESNLSEHEATGKRGFKPALRLMAATDRIVALYDKCFHPARFDAEEYKNDCEQGEALFNAYPDNY